MRESERQSRVRTRELRKSMPRSEALLWSYIRKRALNGARFRREHLIGSYIAVFACPASKFVVEVDGATHSTPEELAHDARRTKYLEEVGWTVIRVSNTGVYENMDGVWVTIAARLASPDRLARDLSESGEV